MGGEDEDDGAGRFMGGQGTDADPGPDPLQGGGVAQLGSGPGVGDLVVADPVGGGLDCSPVPRQAPSTVVVDVRRDGGDGDQTDAGAEACKERLHVLWTLPLRADDASNRLKPANPAGRGQPAAWIRSSRPWARSWAS